MREENLVHQALAGRTLTLLAEMLKYPAGAGEPSLNSSALAGMPAAAQIQLTTFQNAVAELFLSERQELFIRTFDFDPDAALEIGWHLFGEDYRRGEFMAFLRSEMRRLNIIEGSDLPDHVNNVLTLTTRWELDLAGEFSARFTLPALEKLTAHLDKKDSPYRHLIRAVIEAIRAAVSLSTGVVVAVQVEEANQL